MRRLKARKQRGWNKAMGIRYCGCRWNDKIVLLQQKRKCKGISNGRNYLVLTLQCSSSGSASSRRENWYADISYKFCSGCQFNLNKIKDWTDKYICVFLQPFCLLKDWLQPFKYLFVTALMNSRVLLSSCYYVMALAGICSNCIQLKK